MRVFEVVIILAILWLIAPYAQARDVTLAWDASTNADAYNVYRAERATNVWSAWQQIATNQSALTYTDTTAPAGCAMWVVTATNTDAESGASNVATDCPTSVPPAPPMQMRIQP